MTAHLPDLVNALVLAAVVMLLAAGYFWWEMRRAVLVDDDGRPVSGRVARAEWEHHVDTALAAAGEPPTSEFSQAIRSMPLTESTYAVVEMLVAGRVLSDDVEEWLAGLETEA